MVRYGLATVHFTGGEVLRGGGSLVTPTPTVKGIRYNRYDHDHYHESESESETKRDASFEIVCDGKLIELFGTPWLKGAGRYVLEESPIYFDSSAAMHRYNWKHRDEKLFDAVTEEKYRRKTFSKSCYGFFPSNSRWKRHQCRGLIGHEKLPYCIYEKDRKLARDLETPTKQNEKMKKKKMQMQTQTKEKEKKQRQRQRQRPMKKK